MVDSGVGIGQNLCNSRTKGASFSGIVGGRGENDLDAQADFGFDYVFEHWIIAQDPVP